MHIGGCSGAGHSTSVLTIGLISLPVKACDAQAGRLPSHDARLCLGHDTLGCCCGGWAAHSVIGDRGTLHAW